MRAFFVASVLVAGLLAACAHHGNAGHDDAKQQFAADKVTGWDVYKRKASHHDWKFHQHYKTLGSAWSARKTLENDGWKTKAEECYD
ncbi:MAG: hypothetical protein HYR84_08290 [Planctomycetes bacterium]|nr:hypothetical protein [Planctomycetota bacterium]